MDSCTICNKCKEKREDCKHPQMSRPAPEALAVDVFSTVKQYDFPIDVRTDYSQEMNRYAFLMIE
jgi:predicted metal-binding protein